MAFMVQVPPEATEEVTKTGKPSKLKRVIYFPVTLIIIEAVLVLLSVFLIKKFAIKPALEWGVADPVISRILQGIITLAVLFVSYCLVVKWLERRPLRELERRPLIKESAMGFALAALTISAVILIVYLAGYYRVVGVNRLDVLISPFIWITLLAMVEELVFRGIVYRIMEGAWGTYVALLISAVLFGVVHITNENINAVTIISATTGGFLLSMLFTLTKRLWAPIGFHTAWNFSQVFYGTSVTGTDMFPHGIESELKGPEWITGGVAGPENSVVTILLVFGLFLATYYLARRRGLIIRRRRKEA